MVRSEKGMTLIEVLVAGAVMAGLMLALTTMMNFSSRSVQTSKIMTDFNSLVNELQGVLNNSSNCQTVMSAYKVNPNAPFPQPLSSAITTNGTGTGTVIVPLPPGIVGSTLKISKLEFESITGPVSANQYIVTLNVEATKVVGGSAVGLQSVNHPFPLTVTLAPNHQITQCSGMTDTLWQKAANGTDIYYNNGNVGIGTSSPNHQLSISAAGGGAADLINTNLASGTYWSLQPGAWGADKFGVVRYESGNPVSNKGLIIDNAGNVGIGTTTPTVKLDVNGAIRPGPGTVGGACSPLGAQAYDSSTGAPLYCSNTGVWTAVGGGGFGGAYTIGANGQGGIGCTWPNPVTGGYSCPAGYNDSTVHNSYYAWGACVNQQYYLHVCWR